MIKSIQVTEPELNTNRISQIKLLIGKLAANNSIHPQRVPSNFGGNRIVYCVTDTARITDFGQFDTNSEINERFKTKSLLYNASYYEMWDKISGTKNTYELNRVYFHLYLTENDKEFILLHTDPKDNDVTHGNYKRSPHLHIKDSNSDIISHAHFALNINDYDKALSSLSEINQCLKNHIEMLCHQILIIR